MDYAIELARTQIRQQLEKVTGTSGFEIRAAPPKVPGDLAVPLFLLARERGLKVPELGEQILARLDLSETLFARAELAGGFLNFTLDTARYLERVMADLGQKGEAYGGSDEGGGRAVVIDYSSPNIAKPFSVGHLRSTNIGHAIAEIHRFLGYEVVGDNHIGDWGTQFGKLMCAYSRWGEKGTVEARPIEELLALYVRFHDEAEADPGLEIEARDWFRRLESGEAEATSLWQWFRDLSWKEFEKIYELLGVRFEEVLGESFYNDRLQPVVDRAFELGLATWGTVPRKQVDAEDELATREVEDDARAEEKVAVIHLDAHGIDTPLLIQKSDGTSLYATRDLATAIYRVERWHPAKILYVVGGEQQLYFRQVFKAFELMGYDTPCEHIWFGLIRLPGGRMSTRKGRVVFLEDVINEAVSRAEVILEDRDLSPEERRAIARQVGIGAIKYADLAQTRTKDVLFEWDRMLSLQGDSAPYLQYACVRIRSILRKGEEDGVEAGRANPALLTGEGEIALVKTLGEFPDVVHAAGASCQPHLVATFLVQLARAFHAFYTQHPVLKAETPDLIASRLLLCRATLGVLVRGLTLLGIEAPRRM